MYSRLHHRATLFAAAAAGLLLGLAGCSPGLAVRSERHALRLGETTVPVVVHAAEAAGLTYLNLHDDEGTSVAAALRVVRRHGGRVVELRHTGARNVAFTVDGRAYAADPNRIFTDAGAWATLRRLGAATDTAHAAVRSFAEALLVLVGARDLSAVVTLHNNTDGAYAATSYAAGGDYAADARRVHLAPGRDPDDFAFVTEPRLFDALRAAGLNVVEQDPVSVTDDGSLSVYAARKGIPYVNVEAEHGHEGEQVRMLDVVRAALGRLYGGRAEVGEAGD